MAGNDTKLEILSSHYSETFSLLKEVVARRDRLFLYILGVIFLLLLYMSAPSAVSDWLNQFINSKSGNNSPTANLIEASFVGAVLLLGLLSLSHTYFQTVLHIERQYDYVYQLEVKLSEHFDGEAFIREGKHYRKYKRLFSKWTKGIFWILFPMLYVVFLIYWVLFLFTTSQASTIYKVVDGSIVLSILVSLGLYMFALVKKK